MDAGLVRFTRPPEFIYVFEQKKNRIAKVGAFWWLSVSSMDLTLILHITKIQVNNLSTTSKLSFEGTHP
jgi:hypothetical protein